MCHACIKCIKELCAFRSLNGNTGLPMVIILCNLTKSIPKLCTFYILSYTSQLRKGIVHS